QIAAVVDRLGAAVADRDDRARLIVARARRVQPEAHRSIRHEREVARELDLRAVLEPRWREAYGHAGCRARIDADVERARRAALDARREAAAHEPVVRGALRDGELGHRRRELARLSALPAPDLREHARA